jgi:hypothetical protein
MRVELAGNFWGDLQVRAAHSHSHASVGLLVRSLTWMAAQGWDPSPGTGHFFPDPIGWLLLEQEVNGWPKTRRPFNALERSGLWVPIVNRKGKVGGGWNMTGAGRLWRIRPDREPITPWVRRAVLERDGRVCQICGGEVLPSESLHLDHKVPVSRFGRSTVDNLQVAHALCNLKKGARVLGGAA